MFSCQFCKIFKNTFFIEHLRWLLLPILKLLDSQRQWCKWISKLVKIYFISTFLVLFGILVFIFGEQKLSFYISTALWLRKYNIFDFRFDHIIKVSRDSLVTHPESAPYQVLGAMGLVNVEIKRFWFVTWPRDWCVTWLFGWGSLILSQHLAKFGLHRLCESRNTTFFICHRTAKLKCHVTFWMVTPHPKSPIG